MDASDLAQLANISKQYARGLLRARVLNLGILAKVSIALDTNLIMEIALSLPLEEPPCPPNR